MTNDNLNISLELLLKHSRSNLYFGVKSSRCHVHLPPRTLALRHQSLAFRARLLCATNEAPEEQAASFAFLLLSTNDSITTTAKRTEGGVPVVSASSRDHSLQIEPFRPFFRMSFLPT